MTLARFVGSSIATSITASIVGRIARRVAGLVDGHIARCIAVCGVVSLLLSCSANHARPSEPTAVLQGFSGPPNVVLDVACTPSGLEMCFDAIDNNCNGLIDEGCGVRTGILQFSIAWEDSKANVDLDVVDTSGSSTRTRATTTNGFRKDRDCPGENNTCQGQNMENVYLTIREIPRGKINVLVRWKSLGDEPAPLKVRMGARVGQRSYSTVLQLDEVGAELSMVFEM